MSSPYGRPGWRGSPRRRLAVVDGADGDRSGCAAADLARPLEAADDDAVGRREALVAGGHDADVGRVVARPVVPQRERGVEGVVAVVDGDERVDLADAR